MIRFLTKECVGERFEHDKLQRDIKKYSLIMNKEIWNKGKDLFKTIEKIDVVPVLNEQYEFVCFAWQDREANRELRMLHELETCCEALSFRDLYPDCTGVIIHGCNELAWHMMKYLENIGIAVIVEGKFWEILSGTISQNISEDYNYEIWAEGVYEEKKDWKNSQLRSASAEFECIDKIYEANIKAGKIKDAQENCEELLSRLKNEKEIVIRGLGTKAQDAYDWLMANGIDICAFQSDRVGIRQQALFGRPVLNKAEVVERFKKAVILECGSMHSAWGFGDVDDYDYYGYKRNKKYFLLRDYVNVPNSNLEHILVSKNVILTGDIRLCNRIYRWLSQNEKGIQQIKYWDVLKENQERSDQLKIPKTDIKEAVKDAVFILVLPKHFYEKSLNKETVNQSFNYYEEFERHGVFDFTEYFSDIDKMIYLEMDIVKYHHEKLRPAGFLLGAIPGYCGNELVRDCLQGHPQIIMMKYSSGIGVPLFLDIELYTICIRLAEESANDILSEFWKIYENETDQELINKDFAEREKFDCKMEELLKLSDRFSSQELFVMFHLAYLAMYGKEISNLKEVFIYWEPHWMPREYIRRFAYWLGCNEVKGITLIMVRNRYIIAGSSIRGNLNGFNWRSGYGYMYNCIFIKSGITHKYWDEHVIRFEDLKCYPGKVLKELYERMSISCESVLIETNENTCSDNGRYNLKPAYNLYEEYFTGFDRMRISLAAGNFQKQYGYPYESCSNFSRRELQELFLKGYRWERLPGALEGKDEENIIAMQFQIRKLLWMQRFSEIMEVVLDEAF